jgi:glyceraldehyde-3-phosphate dehydrogenase/erythrose-4-phosphate dehydrogenase
MERVTLTDHWRIATVRTVIENSQAATIDGVLIDTTTAQAVVTVYEALNAKSQAVAQRVPMVAFAAFAWSRVA